jgi:hypothetical protein
MRRVHRPVLLIALALVPSCVIDTVPLPEDERTDEGGAPYPFEEDPRLGGHDGTFGDIDQALIYFSSAPTLLVGAEGALPEDGLVVVDNEARGWRGQVESIADGSFAMPVNASVGDTVVLRFIQNSVVVAEASLTIAPGSVEAFQASSDLDGAPHDMAASPGLYVVASSPNGSGLVTVNGTASTVSPGILVVVANLDGGGATTASAESNGSFSATLLGASGDELAVFAVEPASSNGGGETFYLTVP